MEFYIGQVLMFAGNFAPQNWAFCRGQLLPIASYNALFAILGTQYGGDGRTTFALPDLQGRVPVGTGSGPGLTPRTNGQKFGVETVNLTVAEMPSHGHTPVSYEGRGGGQTSPGGHTWGPTADTAYNSNAPNTQMNVNSISQTGGNMPHQNVQPSLGMNYIICMQGLFPPRS